MTNREVYNSLEKMLEMENKSNSTYMRYAKAINEMETYLKNKNLSDLKEEQIGQYAYYLHKQSKSSRTYNSKIAAIRYMYRKAIKRPIEDCYLPLKRNEKKAERIIPSKDEMAKIIKNCKDIELLSFIMLASGSGLRISEIASLKIANIIKGRNIIEVIGKGKRQRTTVVDDVTLNVLRRYYKYNRVLDNEYLFSRRNHRGYIKTDEVTRRLRKYLEEMNMNYTMHDFRRVFATIMYEAGVDLITIQRYLGHDSIVTTMKYINIEKYEQKKEVSPINEIFRKTSRNSRCI